jgi:hypothetical protein
MHDQSPDQTGTRLEIERLTERIAVLEEDRSRLMAYCGIGYVSASGEPISPAIVEGETVCIEQLEVDAQQVIQGLPGSPRYRCLKHAQSAGQEMRCYQEPGEP